MMNCPKIIKTVSGGEGRSNSLVREKILRNGLDSALDSTLEAGREPAAHKSHALLSEASAAYLHLTPAGTMVVIIS